MAESVHTITVYEEGILLPVGLVNVTTIAPAVVAEGDAVTAVGGFTELKAASSIDTGEVDVAFIEYPVEALGVIVT